MNQKASYTAGVAAKLMANSGASNIISDDGRPEV